MSNQKTDYEGLKTFMAALRNAVAAMIAKAGFDRTALGKVMAVNSDGTYTVAVFGGNYKLPCKTKLTLYQNVYVKAPQNNFNLLYIEQTL